ncbi:MAG: bifunctional phosphoribosyl-AMP cyclohydrolase/phosphoribosyl-ATP diphosphatase HisIE [Myxococcales bacterium]|nr:bifunctional phosphoribosyl-AMP cyclohydrolase/phosphoribosyl-ATP diphosphatase HisIE [Myxococcales bacterium]MCB9750353.1 bifunctional phosphoribosyl-AMP cyclohydrolase/phosphoribosyl-ATP diphosphatase HisIE [Myxococcales bacterium]
MRDADATVESLWSKLRPSSDGLVAAVVQHASSGQVLMLGYMNRDALAATLRSGHVTFWSRSRERLWEKGETSGNTLDLRGLWADCDGDALLVLAAPRGPTCHTERDSCFFRRVAQGDGCSLYDEDHGPAPGHASATFERVFATILERKAGRGATSASGKSYVRGLMDRGVPKISEKINEEAAELCDALAAESDAAVAREAADVLFHAMVGLALRGVSIDDVAAVLRERMGVSGLDERAARRR